MRDPWIRTYFGPETTPRPGLRDELAEALTSEWRAAGTATSAAAAAATDDLWSATQPEARPNPPAAAPTGHRHEPVPLQRRPIERPQRPGGGRRWTQIGIAAAAVLAVVGVVVWRQQAANNTVPSDTPVVTLPGGGTAAPGATTIPGQPGSTAAGGDPSASTTIDQGENTAQGTQYMSPACHETRPTTAIPPAIDPAILETGTNDEGDFTFHITLPEPQAGAEFTPGTLDVRVVPGGVLVKASLALPDGTTSDTLLSVVNNDGVVRWTRCFTNAYTLGAFGENGDGSATIWVARNTTSLARYVDLATGDTTELFSGYTPTTNRDGTTGVTFTHGVNDLFVWLPEAADLGSHDVTLP